MGTRGEPLRADETAGTVTGSPGLSKPAGPSPAPLEIHPRGSTIGRYVVLDHLGTGGMGVVYRAYDPELNRQVALKLMRAPAGGGTGDSDSDGVMRSRLIREAQALARLSHPNVVAVHDVGEVDAGVFVAMELVEGDTARDWMNAQPRSPRAILDLFLAAGRGLAAAHDAGLAHRDFKPSNIAIGRDGRVRVLDFGVARALDSEGPGEKTGRAPPVPDDLLLDTRSATASGDQLASPLTEAGALVGTPAYMAPEQLAGEQAGPAGDQFSFAVSMWIALFGVRPFRALTRDALLASVRERELQRPARARVPGHIERALRRALSASPDDRYPSMAALLADLARDPWRRRRHVMAAIGAVAVAAALGAGWLRHAGSTAPSPCAGAADKLHEVWDDQRRAAVTGAFTATGAPFAADAVRGTTRALDRYAGDWVAMHTEACAATRIRGEQSAQLMDLRIDCLERRRDQLRAQVDVFAEADRDVVIRAVQAAESLPTLDGCADAVTLLAAAPPLENEAERQRVEHARRDLARVRALFEAGKYGAAQPALAPVLAEADALRYSPLEAEVHLLQGGLGDRQGRYSDAERHYLLSIAAADRGRVDETRARALLQLTWIVGVRLGRFDEADRWATQTLGAIGRLGEPDDLLAKHYRVAGVLGYMRGDYDRALEMSTRATELAKRALGEDDPYVAACENDIGAAHYYLGDYDRARDFFELAQKRWERAYGPMHPDVSTALNNVGEIYLLQKRYDEAEPILLRSLAIAEAIAAPERAEPMYNLGAVARARGNLPAALERYRAAIEVWVSLRGPNHPRVALALVNIAAIEGELGHHGDAVAALERAVAIREAAPDVAPDDLAAAQFALARTLIAAGSSRARARALAIIARDAFAAAGDRGAEQRTAVDAWLASEGRR